MKLMTVKKAIQILEDLIERNKESARRFQNLTKDWEEDSLTRSMRGLSVIFACEADTLTRVIKELQSSKKSSNKLR
jgi:hypothetical protein